MRDAQDIEEAVRTFGDAVWRACLVYLKPDEAEDVFQNVFLAYAQHEGTFHSVAHTKAWLLRVAINDCKDVLKVRRRDDASLDAMVEAGETAALGAQDDEAVRALHEVLDAMDALGDPPKTQLYLALYEGYSAPEIARMLDMPLGTVYSWISRGKKRLREALS